MCRNNSINFDKVLFPEIAQQELQDEAAFYKSLGIRRKPHIEAAESLTTSAARPAAAQVRFELVPSSNLPALEYPTLETQGTIRIGQLKRYLAVKIPNLDLMDPVNDLEILCDDLPLGNELSVTFIIRTVWMDEQDAECLTLSYRRRSSVRASMSSGNSSRSRK